MPPLNCTHVRSSRKLSTSDSIAAGQDDRYHAEARLLCLPVQRPLNFLAKPSGGSLVPDADRAGGGFRERFCESLLPQLSWNQHPLVEPDTKSAFVCEPRAEFLDYLGIDVSMAEKHIERFGLVVRHRRMSWNCVVHTSVSRKQRR